MGPFLFRPRVHCFAHPGFLWLYRLCRPAPHRYHPGSSAAGAMFFLPLTGAMHFGMQILQHKDVATPIATMHATRSPSRAPSRWPWHCAFISRTLARLSLKPRDQSQLRTCLTTPSPQRSRIATSRQTPP